MNNPFGDVGKLCKTRAGEADLVHKVRDIVVDNWCSDDFRSNWKSGCKNGPLSA